MRSLSIKIDERVYEIEVEEPARIGAPFCVRVNGETLRVFPPTAASENESWVMVEDRLYEVLTDPDLRWILSGGRAHKIEIHETQPEQFLPERGDGIVKAPIPGQVSKILVQPGECVCQGQTVIMLEAMKMLNELKAPRCGVVEAVHIQEGVNVNRGDLLIEIGDHQLNSKDQRE